MPLFSLYVNVDEGLWTRRGLQRARGPRLPDLIFLITSPLIPRFNWSSGSRVAQRLRLAFIIYRLFSHVSLL